MTAAARGLAATVALMAVAMLVPAATGWDVHVRWFPPLHAVWGPRVGVGTLPSIVLAFLAARSAVDLAERLSWRWLLAAVFAAGLAWMLSLALVDGTDGIGYALDSRYEYLRTARRVTDVHQLLQEYVSRIPYDSAPKPNWPVHVAGHPPGALLFFIGLDRVGLGDGLAAGMVVTVLAATTAVAVLICVRVLGEEAEARRAAPFLVFAPAAVWQAVSADAMFAAVAALGARRAGAGRHPPQRRLVARGRAAARRLRDAVLRPPAARDPRADRARAGRARGSRCRSPPPPRWRSSSPSRCSGSPTSTRCPSCTSATSPASGAGARRPTGPGAPSRRSPSAPARSPAPASPACRRGLPRPVDARDRRARRRGLASVLVADATQHSKAEVERIWLPFVPWILLSCALLPDRWRRRGLVLQLAVALAVEHLLQTGW